MLTWEMFFITSSRELSKHIVHASHIHVKVSGKKIVFRLCIVYIWAWIWIELGKTPEDRTLRSLVYRYQEDHNVSPEGSEMEQYQGVGKSEEYDVLEAKGRNSLEKKKIVQHAESWDRAVRMVARADWPLAVGRVLMVIKKTVWSRSIMDELQCPLNRRK